MFAGSPAEGAAQLGDVEGDVQACTRSGRITVLEAALEDHDVVDATDPRHEHCHGETSGGAVSRACRAGQRLQRPRGP